MALEHIFVVRVDKIPKLLNEYSVFSFCLKQPLPDAIKQIFANSVHTFHFFSPPQGKKVCRIQLAQCRFPRMTIANAKILTYFSNKIYGINFIKQHSETVMV